MAVGTDSDLELLSDIAGLGGGRSYYTDDPDSIPRIFTDETKIVAKKLIVEKEMQPLIRIRGEMLRGIPLSDLPMVYGHVLTYPNRDPVSFLRHRRGRYLCQASMAWAGAWPLHRIFRDDGERTGRNGNIMESFYLK